ncbi:MAG TPA: glycine betaine ABC transporter substrate-binding protein [Actinoplanes sp.]|nr:glycine betaine ABC transporter substrate-binding protein [Actinoplanes sp.]
MPAARSPLNALFKGQIDVGNVFSTDSAITTNKLVVLEDPKNLYLILAATGPSPA